MNQRFFDYRNMSALSTPSFMNVIKPKKTLTGKFLSKDSLSSINNLINGAQKAINIYDRAVPIIKQTTPLINNIKTTFKVAKAFKSFSNESSLEKAFDHLPDYEETTKREEKEEVKTRSNPFYPTND